MKYSKLVRRVIALSFTSISLVLALGSAQYPIWIEALKTLSIPLGVIMAGYFSVESVKNYKKHSE